MKQYDGSLGGEETERDGASVREAAADRIRAGIVSGELLPGQRLPERELGVLTGAARTTVREAIRQLESEGLITTVPYRGPMVSVLSEEEARDIYELRVMLEGQAGRLFVERASDELVAALRETVEDTGRAHEAGDFVGVVTSSDRFYRILTEGAGNKSLAQMLLTIQNRLAIFRFSSTRWPGRAQSSMVELRDIAAAVEARDAAAAETFFVKHMKAAAELALMILSERAQGAAGVNRPRPLAGSGAKSQAG